MGCIVEEGLGNVSSSSIPWNDLYITAASAGCLIAMLIDFIMGAYYRKPSLPSKIFSLNATSLMLLEIATRQTADLTTAMPSAEEQFTKLSGAALVCVAMCNFMASLGPMQGSDLFLNVLPLTILVLTVMRKVCIQMGTGVIHAFLPEHIITLCVMLIMLLITCSAALTVPTMKQSLKKQYELKREQASSVGSDDDHKALTISIRMVERFKVDLRKYWTMALSCNPHYVLSRSCLGSASDFLCLLEFIVVIQAYGFKVSQHSKGPAVLVSYAQLFAVAVGSLASYIRRSAVVDTSEGGLKDWMPSFLPKMKTERYWTKVFEEWEDNPLPLPLNIQRRRLRRWIHDLKSKILKTIRWLHTMIVFFAKLLVPLTILVPLFSEFKRRIDCTDAVAREFADEAHVHLLPSRDASELKDLPELKEELKKFVLYLEGEDVLADKILTFCYLKAEKWFWIGRKKPSVNVVYLAALLNKSISYESFEGVDLFNDDHASSSGSGSGFEETGNCWALPLVTLTGIAVAISCPEGTRIKSLLNEVSEGLKYARLVDEKLDLQDLPNVTKAADVIWLGIDLYQRWLDVDLAALAIASEAKDPTRVIEHLAEKGKSCVTDFENSMAVELPPRVLAGYSMHKICHTILRKCIHLDGNQMFELLHVLISDMMVACLTRLPKVLLSELHNSCIEAKEDSVREAACLLGEVERIIEVLGERENDDLVINQCKFIDFWRPFLLGLSTTTSLSSVISASDEIV